MERLWGKLKRPDDWSYYRHANQISSHFSSSRKAFPLYCESENTPKRKKTFKMKLIKKYVNKKINV